MDYSKITRRGVVGGVAATVGLAATGSSDLVSPAHGAVDDTVLREYFMNLSAEGTGFSRADLDATAQSVVYFDSVRNIIGDAVFGELLQLYHDGGFDAVLNSKKYGPIARNITKLWYAATWEQLPREWRDAYGSPPNDKTFVISSDAYTTGLLWAAIGVNPPGANAPGFGTWSDPPNIPTQTP